MENQNELARLNLLMVVSGIPVRLHSAELNLLTKKMPEMNKHTYLDVGSPKSLLFHLSEMKINVFMMLRHLKVIYFSQQNKHPKR